MKLGDVASTCQPICGTDVINTDCVCGVSTCVTGRFCVENTFCYTEADATACTDDKTCGVNKNCLYEENNSHCVANISSADCNISENCLNG